MFLRIYVEKMGGGDGAFMSYVAECAAVASRECRLTDKWLVVLEVFIISLKNYVKNR
jgi:hypothetical protein